MELLGTNRTYKTYNNAYKALLVACEKTGHSIDSVRWVIGATSDGRFAPTVVGINRDNNDLWLVGIHWIS